MHETDAPRELAIDKNNHSFYEDLKKGKILPELKGYEMAYLFIIAMAYGIHYKRRKPLQQGQIKRSITRTFVEKDFEFLIKAIAISLSDEGVEIIADKAQIFKIAEEYANGGIEIIKNTLSKSRPGTFETTMETELSKIQKESSK